MTDLFILAKLNTVQLAFVIIVPIVLVVFFGTLADVLFHCHKQTINIPRGFVRSRTFRS